jgi:DNA-binding cell septation regulator SpoVG
METDRRITVLSVRLLTGRGNLRAMADVTCGPLTLCGVRVIQQPGQAAYVLLPQTRDKDGQYWPVVKTDSATKEAIQTEVLRAYEMADANAK